jgi:CRP-like cAMP-binding protein
VNSAKQIAGENRLLAALTQLGRQRLLASCEHVELRVADVPCRAGERIKHVHFPTDSIISTITALADGSRLEVGLVGHEGMLGACVALGINIHPQHAIVQGAGSAWRMSVPAFQRHARESVELRRLLNCYVYVLMGQLAQSAACSHYHLVQARLARWLLMTRDRARRNQFDLTQEFLAHLLGARRVGITKAASSLREQGLIEYRRGAISILDEAGLEQASCACYRGASDMYERALGPSRPVRRRRGIVAAEGA